MTSRPDIRPFRIDIPEADLADLRDRLARTRWGTPMPAAGCERGMPLDQLRELADFWANGYDWRAAEAELNSYPQGVSTIDGQDVHFLHVRSADAGALPLILLHGWPGSIVEFLDLIPLLTDRFHLVIPSLPGFGFSGPVHEPGWDCHRMAVAFAELMRRLGYSRYGAQGGDWGAVIAPDLGRVDPQHVVGVHVNAAMTGFVPIGAVDPAEVAALPPPDQARLGRIKRFFTVGNGYYQMQATRPQTIAHALVDSPVGQLAWIAEKFDQWVDVPIDRDRVLTNVMLYWLTGTAGSAVNIYYEETYAEHVLTSSGVPTGVAVFAADFAIRHYAEPFNHIVRWTEFDRIGHFAALEAPDVLAAEVRAFFESIITRR
jgi:pimeloyl-ACP methyl ester carboxylesterase